MKRIIRSNPDNGTGISPTPHKKRHNSSSNPREKGREIRVKKTNGIRVSVRGGFEGVSVRLKQSKYKDGKININYEKEREKREAMK